MYPSLITCNNQNLIALAFEVVFNQEIATSLAFPDQKTLDNKIDVAIKNFLVQKDQVVKLTITQMEILNQFMEDLGFDEDYDGQISRSFSRLFSSDSNIYEDKLVELYNHIGDNVTLNHFRDISNVLMIATTDKAWAHMDFVNLEAEV